MNFYNDAMIPDYLSFRLGSFLCHTRSNKEKDKILSHVNEFIL